MQDEIVECLSEDNVKLTPHMLHPLLEGIAANHEHERAIFLFRDVRARKVAPRDKSYRYMISLCTEINEAEEAFRILLDFQSVPIWIPRYYWWLVLECCARNGFVDSLENRLLIPAGRNVTLLAVSSEYC
jgi:hypothetical protein